MATLIRTDGSHQDVFPANLRTGFTLDELYLLLGCEFVETLSMPDDGTLVFAEDAKVEHDPMNIDATMLARVSGIARSDFIAGNALLCKKDELQ